MADTQMRLNREPIEVDVLNVQPGMWLDMGEHASDDCPEYEYEYSVVEMTSTESGYGTILIHFENDHSSWAFRTQDKVKLVAWPPQDKVKLVAWSPEF